MHPIIHVIAGAPGAGKTSLGAAMRHLQGLDYFDSETFACWAHEDGEQDLRGCLELDWRQSVGSSVMAAFAGRCIARYSSDRNQSPSRRAAQGAGGARRQQGRPRIRWCRRSGARIAATVT